VETTLENDECVKVWLDRIGTSQKDCLRVFKRFRQEVLAKDERFKNLTPSKLIDWQVNAKGRQAYVIKGLAQRWIDGHGWRFGTKQTYLSQISSFWLHNHAPWPDDPSFHFSSDTPPVDGRLDFEAFRRILLNCDKKYRAVFLMQAHMLAGEGDLVYVNVTHWKLVLEALTKNVGVFKIPLPGRKANRNKKTFYMLLSTKSDWGEAMRDYLKSISTAPVGVLFRNNEGNPLSTYNIRHYFHRRAIEAGVIKEFSPPCRKCGGETVKFRGYKPEEGRTGYRCKEKPCGDVSWASEFSERFSHVRYGVNPHEIRDLMRSRWRGSGAKTVVAEFMMQHNIDANDYDKMKYTPDYAVKEYRLALPWLNVLSEDPEKVSRFEVSNQVDALNKELVSLRREVELGREAKELLTDPEVLAYLKRVKKKLKE